jgi:hypothetical protein
LVVKARKWADYVISYYATPHGVDGALANGTDFIAVAGKDMMLIINDFKLKWVWKGHLPTKKIPPICENTVAVGYWYIFEIDIKSKLDVPEFCDPAQTLLLLMGRMWCS